MTLWRHGETTTGTHRPAQHATSSRPSAPAGAPSASPPPPWPRPPSPARPATATSRPRTRLTLKRQLPASPAARAHPDPSDRARAQLFTRTRHGAGPCLPRQPGPCLSAHHLKGHGHPCNLAAPCPPGWRIPTLDGARSRGIYVQFYDPDGHRYGMPTYPYHWAPEAPVHRPPAPRPRAAPRRAGPRRPDPVAPRHCACAYLYRADLALPKRQATPAQLAAIAKALRARRTCPTCGPRSPTTSRAHSANATTAPDGGHR